LVTLHDVAARAGVSPATVSRVLRGQTVVAPETRARVMEAVEGLGYHPNIMAQGLRLGRGNQVALLISDIEQAVYASLTKHLQEALQSIGLELLLFNLDHNADRLKGLLERAPSLRLAGVVIASSDPLDLKVLKPLIDQLAVQEIQVVAVGQNLSRQGIPSVFHDDAAAARVAVGFLLERGYGPVAYVGRTSQSAIGRERFKGYRLALADAGIAVDDDLVWSWESRYRYQAGYEAFATALGRGVKVRGVLGASDELALGAMAAAIDRGFRVPDDIAIVGFGGIEVSEHARPALSTMSSDPRGVGAHVRDILLAAREGRKVPMRLTLERQLLVRQSA